MHPVEHLLYYSCATIPPLLLSVHPLHFLYCKFHADIAPIGGHDGHGDPGGNGDFHWLHHAKFECNYGVPWPFDFDTLFGTWVDYREYKESGQIKASEKVMAMMHEPDDEDGGNDAPSTDKEAPLLGKGNAEEGTQRFTMEEVSKHNTRYNCWIVLYGKVLDVTIFLAEHPGGEQAILNYAGKDATKTFELIHRASGGFDLVGKHAPEAVIGVAPDAPSYDQSTENTQSTQSTGKDFGQFAGLLFNALATTVAVFGTMWLVVHLNGQPWKQ